MSETTIYVCVDQEGRTYGRVFADFESADAVARERKLRVEMRTVPIVVNDYSGVPVYSVTIRHTRETVTTYFVRAATRQTAKQVAEEVHFNEDARAEGETRKDGESTEDWEFETFLVDSYNGEALDIDTTTRIAR